MEALGKQQTVLPVRVDETDITTALFGLEFNYRDIHNTPNDLAVSGTYVDGLLYLYKEFGNGEDILGRVIERNIPLPEGSDHTLFGKDLKKGMIPWPLYEIVAEEVRLQLAQERPTDSMTHATFFPFVVGLHGVINEPRLVAAAAVLPLERIIHEVNQYNALMNKVTTLEFVDQGLEYNGKKATAKLLRRQKREAIEALDTVLASSVSVPEARRNVIHSICSRDFATTLGAFFGMTILAGKPMEYVTFTGDPAEDAIITISYSNYGQSALQRVDQVWTAAKLALYRQFTSARWLARSRTSFVDQNIGLARSALQTVELQTAEEERTAYASAAARAESRAELERAHRETLEARLAFEQTVGETNRIVLMVHGIFHDLKTNLLTQRRKATLLLLDTSQFYPGFQIDQATLKKEDLFDARVEYLASDTGVPLSLRKCAQYFLETRKRLADMLEQAREGMQGNITTNIQPVPYKPLLEDAIRLINPMYPGLRMTHDCPDETLVNVDSRYISVALKNLLDNAAYASAQGEKPEVTIAVGQIPRAQRTYIQTVITQSGILLDEIADQLNSGLSFTTKGENGNGIGSSASYGIIKGMHQGSIRYSPTTPTEKATITIAF